MISTCIHKLNKMSESNIEEETAANTVANANNSIEITQIAETIDINVAISENINNELSIKNWDYVNTPAEYSSSGASYGTHSNAFIETCDNEVANITQE